MARTVTFYKMALDKRYLDKTRGLSNASTINTVHFIDDTEIVNPILKLSAFDEDMCNYVYIPSLRRYYYITGVTYSKGYYFVNLHVDVLMSFKESIKKQKVLVNRSSKDEATDLYLQDDKFCAEQYTCVKYLPFTGGNAFKSNISQFVLAVMGTGGDTPDDGTININVVGGTMNNNVSGSVGTHDDTTPPINNL